MDDKITKETKREEETATEKRWAAVLAKDKTAGASFVYAVTSTGIYCRPGCSSRLPKRKNVLFFDSPGAAAQEGFRPCKRCRPDTADPGTRHCRAILHACHLLDREEDAPSLQELAAACGFSPHYFQRLFKKEVGITPKQYAKAQRLERLRHSLKNEASVTEAIYAAGFHSSSRAYAQCTQLLGMSPSSYRRGGKGLSIQQASAPCALGWVLVGTTEKGICFIALDDNPDALLTSLKDRFPQARISPANPEFSVNLQKIVTFIDGYSKACDLPLDIQGTAFQQQVWSALAAIPPGITLTYSELAERIGRPRSIRAVANACGANPVAVVIPCHRIIRRDGSLGGYRWGIKRKKILLEREHTAAQTEATREQE